MHLNIERVLGNTIIAYLQAEENFHEIYPNYLTIHKNSWTCYEYTINSNYLRTTNVCDLCNGRKQVVYIKQNYSSPLYIKNILSFT